MLLQKNMYLRVNFECTEVVKDNSTNYTNIKACYNDTESEYKNEKNET